MQRKLVVLLLVAAAVQQSQSNYVIIKDESIWTPPITYEQAGGFCRSRIGGSYRLASLETKEEEELVTQMAVDDPDVDLLWVGGKWNSQSNSFVWETGVPFRNGVNWMPGQPTERNFDGRVALVASNNTHKGLTTLNQNQRLFFVCEFHMP